MKCLLIMFATLCCCVLQCNGDEKFRITEVSPKSR